MQKRRTRERSHLARYLVAAAPLLWSSPSLAESAAGPSAGAVGTPPAEISAAPATADPAGPARPPLGPLPKPPSLELPPPAAAELEALDQHLAELVSKDRAVRDSAVRTILEVERGRLSAIRRRLNALAEGSDHQAMKSLLLATREKEQKVLRAREDGDEDKGLDYLEMLSRHARPEAKAWRDLVQTVAMARMLRQIGTVGAAREIVGVYARFGEFLRLEMQRQLVLLGEKAAAALIEAERHPAKKISTWATRQLDAIGKAIPGEAIQTGDPEVLADVLRAYGRTRNPEAARLVVSFVSSERAQIREAARQAVVMLGEVGNWQLRDTYESVVGRKPPREWSWDRLARELFAEFDRMRLAEVYVLFERGRENEQRGKLDEMAELYDQVLAQSPHFERGPEMVSGYLAFAESHLENEKDRASLALSRVKRLAPESDLASKKAESLLLTLQAERLLTSNVADPTIVAHALTLDPKNERARRLHDALTHGSRVRPLPVERYVGAGAIGLAAAVAVAFILLRKRRQPEPSPAPAVDAGGPPPDPDGTAPSTIAEAPPPQQGSLPDSTAPAEAPSTIAEAPPRQQGSLPDSTAPSVAASAQAEGSSDDPGPDGETKA